ncbi:hypothetical protein PUN28_016931 [Cardiocondyla obscurior]|uniref:Uncharacterized protein n=1 Tax=Cardiocondyla obscurior TaxID=286306 RepID=A0AAW2ENE6_9HYME
MAQIKKNYLIEINNANLQHLKEIQKLEIKIMKTKF